MAAVPLRGRDQLPASSTMTIRRPYHRDTRGNRPRASAKQNQRRYAMAILQNVKPAAIGSERALPLFSAWKLIQPGRIGGDPRRIYGWQYTVAALPAIGSLQSARQLRKLDPFRHASTAKSESL